MRVLAPILRVLKKMEIGASCYQPSGRFTGGGLGATLLCGLAAAALLGFIYGYVKIYVPLPYQWKVE